MGLWTGGLVCPDSGAACPPLDPGACAGALRRRPRGARLAWKRVLRHMSNPTFGMVQRASAAELLLCLDDFAHRADALPDSDDVLNLGMVACLVRRGLVLAHAVGAAEAQA